MQDENNRIREGMREMLKKKLNTGENGERTICGML